MSLFRNIMALYICIALVMWVGGIDTPFSSFVKTGGDFQALFDGFVASFGFSGAGSNVVSLLALPAVLIAIVAGGGFAVPVLIAVLAANMMISLFTFPVSLGSVGMPPEYATLYTMFTVLLQFLFTLGLVDWIRGEMT